MAVNIPKQMTEQQGQDMIAKHIHYTALLLLEYSLRQLLDSPLIVKQDRYEISNKYKYTRNQLTILERSALGLDRELIKKNQDVCLGPVSIQARMVEMIVPLMGAVSLITDDDTLDFIENEFEKAITKAMNNLNKKRKNEQQTNESR